MNVIFKGLSIFSRISLIKKHLFEANSPRARLLPICQVRELIRLPLPWESIPRYRSLPVTLVLSKNQFSTLFKQLPLALCLLLEIITVENNTRTVEAFIHHTIRKTECAHKCGEHGARCERTVSSLLWAGFNMISRQRRWHFQSWQQSGDPRIPGSALALRSRPILKRLTAYHLAFKR